MKRFIFAFTVPVIAALGSLSALSPALADHGRGDGAAGYGPEEAVYYDRARVLRADPVYDVVRTPVERRDCWREEYTEVRRGDGGASMVVGSIIGGVIGHQVGDGDGRKVATVAGTIIGAAVGREMGRDAQGEPRTVEERHCRVSEEIVEEEYLRGYHVTYQYQGRRFTTFTDRDPGKFLHVQVGVAPVIE